MWWEEKTHPKPNFNNRPEDNRLAVRVCGEVLNREDADNLNDCDEEAEAKEDAEEDLLVL